VQVFFNFLNDIYHARDISFVVQTQKVIDQVINGDNNINS